MSEGNMLLRTSSGRRPVYQASVDLEEEESEEVLPPLKKMMSQSLSLVAKQPARPLQEKGKHDESSEEAVKATRRGAYNTNEDEGEDEESSECESSSEGEDSSTQSHSTSQQSKPPSPTQPQRTLAHPSSSPLNPNLASSQSLASSRQAISGSSSEVTKAAAIKSQNSSRGAYDGNDDEGEEEDEDEPPADKNSNDSVTTVTPLQLDIKRATPTVTNAYQGNNDNEEESEGEGESVSTPTSSGSSASGTKQPPTSPSQSMHTKRDKTKGGDRSDREGKDKQLHSPRSLSAKKDRDSEKSPRSRENKTDSGAEKEGNLSLSKKLQSSERSKKANSRMLLSTPRKGKRDALSAGKETKDRDSQAKIEKKERKKRKESLKTSLNFKDIRSDDWNGRFQYILEFTEGEDKNRELSNLYADFVHTGQSYGCIIISEKFLDNEQKTIKPQNVGGRAGGVKYKCQGIVFKFAADTHDEESDSWIYGLSQRSDHYAAKAAGHELKGLVNMMTYREKSDLHFPLLALIDYRGFRLIAISWINHLHKNSLQYGSADAARTVHTSNKQLNFSMQRIGMALNLEGHHVGEAEELIYLCGDIEGHVGTDNKFYCLDFARVFPPEYINSRQEKEKVVESLLNCTPQIPSNEFLYKLLRPELVKSSPEPLCSDARSGFIYSDLHPEELKRANRNVALATRSVFETQIPLFASKFSEIPPVDLCKKSFSLTNEVHRLGINCRHLGRLRAELLQKHCTSGAEIAFRPSFVLVEIAARVCKHHIQELWREKMFEIKYPSSEPYKEVAVNYLNVLLRNENNYWTDPSQIKSRIQHAFHLALTKEEMEPSFDLRANFFLSYSKANKIKQLWSLFFKRFQHLVSIQLTPGMNKLIAASKGSSRIKLLSVDIESISTKVKQLDLIDMAEGKMLFLQGMNKEHNMFQKKRLFSMAISRFEAAISSNTNNPQILLAWARSLSCQSDLEVVASKEGFFKLTAAEEKLRMCCDLMNPSREDADLVHGESRDLSLSQISARRTLPLSAAEASLLVDVYFERASILIKLAAHVRFTKTSLTSTANSIDYIRHAKSMFTKINSIRNIAEKSARHRIIRDVTLKIYEVTKQLFSTDVSHIFMDDTNVNSFCKDAIVNETKDKINGRRIVQYITSYYWHQILLSMKYSGAILAQSAELLVRWVTSLAMQEGSKEGAQSYNNLFLRAGQTLDNLILKSSLTFPVQIGKHNRYTFSSERITKKKAEVNLVSSGGRLSNHQARLLTQSTSHNADISKISIQPSAGSNPALPTAIAIAKEPEFFRREFNAHSHMLGAHGMLEFQVKGSEWKKVWAVLKSQELHITMQKEETTSKTEKSKAKEKDRNEWSISVVGAQLTIFHTIDVSHPQSGNLASTQHSSTQQTQQHQQRAHCFRLLTEKVSKGKEKEKSSSSASREKFMFAASTDEEKRMWVAALEHCKISEVLLASLNADHSETRITPTLTVVKDSSKDSPKQGPLHKIKAHDSKLDQSHSKLTSSKFSSKIDFFTGSSGHADPSGKSKTGSHHNSKGDSHDDPSGTDSPQLGESSSSVPTGPVSNATSPLSSGGTPPQSTALLSPHMSPLQASHHSHSAPNLLGNNTNQNAVGVDEIARWEKPDLLYDFRLSNFLVTLKASRRIKHEERLVARTRNLIPSLFGTECDATDNFFSGRLCTFQTAFTFDFGSVEIEYIKVVLSEQVLFAKVNQLGTVVANILFIILEKIPRRKHRDMLLPSKNYTQKKGQEILTTLANDGIKHKFYRYSLAFEKIQHFSCHTKFEGAFYFMGVETVPEGSTLEFEYFNFMGYLKGLNPQDHIIASDVHQLTASVSDVPIDNSGMQLQRGKIVDLSTSAPQRPKQEISKTTIKTELLLKDGQGWLEENALINVFPKMFCDYSWLVVLLRASEKSLLFSEIIAFCAKGILEEPSTAPSFSIADFVEREVEVSKFPLSAKFDEITIDLPILPATFDLQSINLAHSRLANKYVLSEWTSWGQVHSINLSYVLKLDDYSIAEMLINAGKSLLSLNLKGCTQLSINTIKMISIYCPALRHFAMWDAKDVILTKVAESVSVEFLDVSLCKQLSVAFFTKLAERNKQRYIDLSKIDGIVDKETLKKWALKCGPSLGGLNLNNKKVKKGETILACFDDDTVATIIGACPNLISVDLSYLSIGNKTMTALAACTQLQYFKALGPYEFSPASFKKFLGSAANLKVVHLILRSGTPESCKIQDFDILSPLCNQPCLTSLDIRRHAFPDDSGLQKIIQANSRTLKYIDLSFIRCVTDETILQLAKCVQLQTVKIKSCDLVKVDALNELAKSCTMLESANFSGCNISDRTVELLLADKPTFHSLEIDVCNDLTPAVIQVICGRKSLRALCISLKFLNSDHVIKLAHELNRLLYLQILPPNSLPVYRPPALPPTNSSEPSPTTEYENFGHETYSQFLQEVCGYLPNAVIILET